MDFATMRTRILRSLFQDPDTTEQKTLDDVNLAIAESIYHLSGMRFPFNQKDHDVILDGVTSEFDLPEDYLGMTSKIFFRQDGGFTRVIDALPIQQVRESFGEVDHITLNAYVPVQSSLPFVGLDAVTNKMVVSPAINQNVGTLSFRYIADVGKITPKYASSAWTFYFQGELINTSTFTSPWFKEGFQLLYHRTMHLLWSELYGGTEESVLKSKTEYERFNEEVKRINGEVGRAGLVTRVRGYI